MGHLFKNNNLLPVVEFDRIKREKLKKHLKNSDPMHHSFEIGMTEVLN